MNSSAPNSKMNDDGGQSGQPQEKEFCESIKPINEGTGAGQKETARGANVGTCQGHLAGWNGWQAR
jgi:hypothetical protein